MAFNPDDPDIEGSPDQEPPIVPTTAADITIADAYKLHLAPLGAVNHPAPTGPPEHERITVWNRNSKRKVSGNAAPMEKNLVKYLQKHPDCELYTGQDKLLTVDEKQALIAEQNRIPIWNKLEGRKISGNAAPSANNLAKYLRNRPHCEVYNGQDGKQEPRPVSEMAHNGQMLVDEVVDELLASGSSAIPIPQNTSIADMYRAGGEFELAEGQFGTEEVFSMSGLADSLAAECGFIGMSVSPAQRILNDRAQKSGLPAQTAALQSQPPERGRSASIAERILLDRAQKGMMEGQDWDGQTLRPLSRSPGGMVMNGRSPNDLDGMSLGMSIEFSYKDLMGMSAELSNNNTSHVSHTDL